MSKKEKNIYTFDEAFNASLVYFTGDELAARVWVNKYALKDSFGNIYEKTPNDMHRRLANEISRIEHKYPNPITADEIFELIKDFRYIVPQGGSMSGIGNNYQTVSLSNCFVIGDESDSYGGIMKTDQEQVQLMKRRGGVGHDLSHIRPAGSPVLNSALTSTGVVPFMERYSNSTREVAQDGRRGALMLSISVRHPDAESFIDAKMTTGKVTGANVSVKIDDKFMQAVIEGNTYTQQYPIESTNPTIKKEIDARKLWSKIVHNAWQSAEPGILFWDTIINEAIPDCYSEYGYKTTSTNPCVSADTKILTSDGYQKIYDCVGKDTKVWNGSEFSNVIPEKTGNTEQWLDIDFSDGNSLKCTPYHKFYLKNGEKVEAKDLCIGDKLERCRFPVIEGDKLIGDDLYTYGFFCGDGSKKRNESIIDLYAEKKKLIPYFDYRYKYEGAISTRLYIGENMDKHWIPSTKYSIPSRLSYLAGIIDSDGSLNSPDGAINITSINQEYLINLKYLLNTLGSTGVVSKSKDACVKPMPDGKGGLKDYNSKTLYRLLISATNIKKLMGIGLSTNRVQLIADPNRDASRYVSIINITKETLKSPENTYCFTEPLKHKGVFNGILTGQCGEIPLCPYDSCRLIALNLYSYVKNPFTKDATFDIELFKKHVRVTQRMMDDIIDLELEKIDAILSKIDADPENTETKLTEVNLWRKIYEKAKQGRRTGVGITAEGDMLAAMNLRYGTEEATKFSVELHKTIAVEAYRSSVEMAKERGAFLVYDTKKEENNPFIQRIKDADPTLYNEMKQHGRRNISLLTIAPTGTTSLMTQTTSGIEPVFLPVYKRRRKVNPNDKDVNITFTDNVGDSFEEFNVFHHKFITWMKVNGYDTSTIKTLSNDEIQTIVDKSPYYKATSNDIDWLEKVKMQGAIQKWVDHSISVTINLPNDAKEELVGKLYINAWREGCKGLTVYRDGSLDGVLVNIDKKTKSKKLLKRPNELDADVVRFKNNNENWIAFLGLKDDGMPYEIFTGIADDLLPVPKSIKHGKILKQRLSDGTKRYDFQYTNKVGYKVTIEGLSHKFYPEYWNYAKLISGVMRQEMPIINVINLITSLHLDSEMINTWKNGVARILKRYIPNGTKVKSDQNCTNCDSINLIYQEGCLICQDCGSSKCG